MPLFLLMLSLVTLFSTAPLMAQESAPVFDTQQPAQAISDISVPAGCLLTFSQLIARDPYRRETGRRMLDSALMATAVVSIMTRTIDSARPAPYDGDPDAFPSGHTTLAFAVAAAWTERDPRAGAWAYPAAALVGWSRVDTRRHDWGQVLAGMAIGTFIGMQAGKGHWRLFGRGDEAEAFAGEIPKASLMLLDRKVLLWDTRF